MRNLAILVAALVATGGLAGCVGGADDTPAAKTETIDPNNVKDTTGKAAAAVQIKVLAPLNSTITADAAAWLQSGTEIPVSVAPPAQAKGAVNYTWAIGPLPGTVAVNESADTGSSRGADYIKPGASKTITYGKAGIYRMHCHPHPDMRHNVTVIDGYTGPQTVEVLIVDGAKATDSRYFPENIVVGVGTKVTYANKGAQPHTATSLNVEPALKKLALAQDKGDVKVEGNGWQRLVVVMQDAEGRIGSVEKAVYVTPELPTFEPLTFPFEFVAAGGPLAGTPADPAPAKTESFVTAHAGKITLNYSFADAAGANGVPENLAQVEVHLTEQGETQDTLTGGPDAAGSLEGKVKAATYTLTVVPKQGAQLRGEVLISIVFDLVPPPPTAPAAAGGDGHGAHGGHGGH